MTFSTNAHLATNETLLMRGRIISKHNLIIDIIVADKENTFREDAIHKIFFTNADDFNAFCLAHNVTIEV